MSEPELPKILTVDLNDGDIVVSAQIAEGAANGGWGVVNLEVNCRTPVAPDFLEAFATSAAGVLLYGLTNLIAKHEEASGG